MNDFQLGQDFGRALCKHFKLPAGQTCGLKLNARFGEILGATLTISLTASDLIGIGVHMAQDAPEDKGASNTSTSATRTTLSVIEGDTVIIAHPSMLTKDQRGQIADRAKESLPQGVDVLVLDAGMTVAAVVKS